MYMSHIIQTHLVQCHRLLMAFGHVWRQMLAPMMAPMGTNDGDIWVNEISPGALLATSSLVNESNCKYSFFLKAVTGGLRLHQVDTIY